MAKRTLEDLEAEMRSVARGERAAPPRPVLSALPALTEEAIAVMRIILTERPGSVSDVVRSSGRTQSSVSRSLGRLESHGFVRMVRDGRQVRPEAVARRFTIDFETGTYEAERPVMAGDAA